MLYSTILFLHIIGVIVMFVAVGITLMAMISMLYSSETESIQSWAGMAVKFDGLLPLSVIFILLPGLYLVFTSWGWGNSWIDLSLVILISMTIMGPIINLRRLKSILSTAHPEIGKTPTIELLEKVRDRTLWFSVLTMTMLAVALVFLMTVKLALVGSIVTILIAIALGYITSHLILSRAPKIKGIKKTMKA